MLVDKCPSVSYNSFKFNGRYMTMAAKFRAFTAHMNHCSAMAAACSPARVTEILDTAMILAVSILVCLLGLRVSVF